MAIVDWLWTWDVELFRLIHVELRRQWLDPIFYVLSLSGLGHVILVPLLLALIPRATRRYAVACLAGGLIAVAFSSVFKELLYRQRPSNLAFADPIEPVYLAPSFPSGHTTQTMAVALTAFWLLRRTEYRWVAVALLVWASLSSFSRIYVGVHWPTDLLGGLACAAIGSSLAYLWLGRWVVAEAGLEPAT